MYVESYAYLGGIFLFYSLHEWLIASASCNWFIELANANVDAIVVKYLFLRYQIGKTFFKVKQCCVECWSLSLIDWRLWMDCAKRFSFCCGYRFLKKLGHQKGDWRKVIFIARLSRIWVGRYLSQSRIIMYLYTCPLEWRMNGNIEENSFLWFLFVISRLRFCSDFVEGDVYWPYKILFIFSIPIFVLFVVYFELIFALLQICRGRTMTSAVSREV